jgi:hypothetical protein
LSFLKQAYIRSAHWLSHDVAPNQNPPVQGNKSKALDAAHCIEIETAIAYLLIHLRGRLQSISAQQINLKSDAGI